MKPKILVVDDESSHRQMITAVLSAEGYEIKEAVDGNEAVKAVAEKFHDLILMDIRMPGLSGIEALQKIKDISPGIPIIIMTKSLKSWWPRPCSFKSSNRRTSISKSS
jgi:two-component system response regulator HydG